MEQIITEIPEWLDINLRAIGVIEKKHHAPIVWPIPTKRGKPKMSQAVWKPTEDNKEPPF